MYNSLFAIFQDQLLQKNVKLTIISFTFQSQDNKQTFEKRLVHLTPKNVRIAVLLTPGPVANHLTTRGMSSAFKVAITKAKFMTAANQLEANGLGSLVLLDSISSSAHVFVKKTPDEFATVLQLPENSGLVSLEEFTARYHLPTPSYVNKKMQDACVRLGLVHPDNFKQRASKQAVMFPTIARQLVDPLLSTHD